MVKKSERVERPKKTERLEAVARLEKTGRLKTAARPEEVGRLEAVERPEKIERLETVEKPEKTKGPEDVERLNSERMRIYSKTDPSESGEGGKKRKSAQVVQGASPGPGSAKRSGRAIRVTRKENAIP